MKDYYGILGISRGTPPAEIKKAYFGKVREYPPDRHPEEFMQVREAYEILIDEDTRKQYDAMDSMPDIVKLFYNAAKEALREGDSERAVELLERVNKSYKDLSIVNSLLGDAYLKNGNSVKALQMFEILVAKEPGNASFAAKLADAYLMRGWYKKAIDKYRSALLLDEDNISLWLGLMRCHQKADNFEELESVAMEGIGVSKKNGWDCLVIYYHVILADILCKEMDKLHKHLDEMKDIANGNENEKGNVAWFLAKLAKKLQSNGIFEGSDAAINTAIELLPEDPEVQKIYSETQKAGIQLSQFKKLKSDNSFNDVFAEMFDFEMNKCGKKDCIDCEISGFEIELDILLRIESLRSEILRLKTTYNELYAMKSDFFFKALDKKNFDYLMNNYQTRLRRYMKMFPEKFLDEYINPDSIFPQQPARRDENKVGRNDPCPCGSGKKYKKCCGL